jgi:hypothetical protein
VATPSATSNRKCFQWLVSGAEARNGLICGAPGMAIS